MPHFRNGYDKYLDLTEEEYWDRLAYDAEGEYDHDSDRACELALANEPLSPPPPADFFEGEPYEDTYLPGIPDYDRFGRPSWEVED